MPNCKPIKSDFEYSLKDRIKSFLWPIIRFYRQVSRSLAWAKLAWNNYDWDHGYLMEVIVFKLKRMEKEILNGHHIPDKVTNQSLKLCVKLGEKLRKDDYHYFGGLHNAKWGPVEFIEKTDKATGRTYTGMGRSGIPVEKEEQERAEFVEAYRKDDSIKARDTRWFYGIMAKYQEYWWD